MKTYTENEVLAIIKYAVELQKAEDYQEVGRLLFTEGYDMSDIDVKVLDYLADVGFVTEHVPIEEILEEGVDYGTE